MEPFRQPSSTSPAVGDVWVISTNYVLSADFQAAYVYVAAGVTLTIPVGVTLTCCTLESVGDTLVEGVVSAQMCELSPIEISLSREPFRTVQSNNLLISQPSVTTTKEPFRKPSNQGLLGDYP